MDLRGKAFFKVSSRVLSKSHISCTLCVKLAGIFFFFLVDLLHIRLRKSAQVSWRYLWAVMCLSEFCTLTPVSPHLHFLHRVSLRMESLSSQLRRELSSALKGMRNSPYSPFCAVSRCNRCTKIIFGIAVSNGMSYMWVRVGGGRGRSKGVAAGMISSVSPEIGQCPVPQGCLLSFIHCMLGQRSHDPGWKKDTYEWTK